MAAPDYDVTRLDRYMETIRDDCNLGSRQSSCKSPKNKDRLPASSQVEKSEIALIILTMTRRSNELVPPVCSAKLDLLLKQSISILGNIIYHILILL